MAHITRDEFIKLVRASQLKINEDDIPRVLQSLEAVLNYASILPTIVKNYSTQAPQSTPVIVNCLRPDTAVTFETNERLLALCPQREENYFVVPAIIKQS